MTNEELRNKAKAARVYMWEIADTIGISEQTLCRWLRHKLTAEQESKILSAIEKNRGGETL